MQRSLFGNEVRTQRAARDTYQHASGAVIDLQTSRVSDHLLVFVL
jgi:hypothetical protein